MHRSKGQTQLHLLLAGVRDGEEHATPRSVRAHLDRRQKTSDVTKGFVLLTYHRHHMRNINPLRATERGIWNRYHKRHFQM